MMTMKELAVLVLGLLSILAIYGFVFYDMYKCFKNGEVRQITEDMRLAEEESTLGLVEDNEE